MSRRTVSNHAELALIMHSCFINIEKYAHRTLIAIDFAPSGWLSHFAQMHGIRYIGAATHRDRSDQISALLGSENRIIAYELADPIDASLLAALAGTVQYSGVLLLGLPTRTHNHGVPKDQTTRTNNRLTPSALTLTRFSERFNTLLNSFNKSHPENIILVDFQPPKPSNVNKPLEETDTPSETFAGVSHRNTFSNPNLALARLEQKNLFKRASNSFLKNESCCISILGRRGRGKSALTANIANWLYDQNIPYRITAAHHSALSTFHNITHHHSSDHFIAVQNLRSCTCNTVLVDEASNVPLPELLALMQQVDRLILCTTVAGYESSGRAFDLRIQPAIKQYFANHQTLRPEHPWRWLVGDPMEALIDAAVLNDENSSTAPCVNYSDDNPYTIKEITQQQLFENESLLRSVFSLLRATHYQTTVKDLQHLLDGNGVHIWIAVAEETKSLIGTLALSIEPLVENKLHQKVVCKKRRLSHRLLSQLLAQTANSADSLKYNFARIVRISVAQTMRRQGVGSALLKHVEHQLQNNSATIHAVEAIGASFANDKVSVEFWRNNGYTFFHTGFRKNPRTGEQALAVLKSDNEEIKRTLKLAKDINDDNQSWRAYTDETDARILLQAQPYDDQLIYQFSCGQRSLHDTYASLSRISQTHRINLKQTTGVSRKQFEKTLRSRVAGILNLL